MSKYFEYKSRDSRKTRVKTVCKNENYKWRIVAMGDIEFIITKYIETY